MIEVHPATVDRFDDVVTILAPKRKDAPACWCLSVRLPHAEYSTLTGPERPARLRRYAEDGTPPGVVAYVDGDPAGWCSISPRTSHHRLMHSRTIPMIDEIPVWSVICFVVRAQYRRRGVARHLLRGAIDHARAEGAPMIEAYPVDPGAQRISSVFAYVGTTGMFEAAGFTRVAETGATSGKARRWLMRRDLRTAQSSPATAAGGPAR